MLKYTIRRFAEMVLTLFIIASATFFLLAAVPGDPLADRADKLPENIRQNMYHKYGLDKPVLERYVITMRGMLWLPPHGWAFRRSCWAWGWACSWAFWRPCARGPGWTTPSCSSPC